MDLLGEDMPSNGMNRPKFHEVMAAVDQIRKFGSLQNGSCDWGKKFMKRVRRADEHIGRSRNLGGGDRMTTFTSAREADQARNSAEERMAMPEEDEYFNVSQSGLYTHPRK